MIKSMEKIRVREGNTDILYITHEDGSEERFIPDYDLDKANELLMRFYTLKDSTGKVIKDNYKVSGINWFPTVVSYLYWYVFYKYIQYEMLLKDIIDGKYSVEFENKRGFYGIYDLFISSPKTNSFKRFISNLLIRTNNKRVIKGCNYDLLFYRYGLNDFRTTDIKKTLDELSVDYLQVVNPTLADIIYNIWRLKPKPHYFLGGIASHNIFSCQYDLEQYDKYHKRLFSSAIKKINEIIASFIYEYQMHKKILRNSKARVFYGLDDANDVYPILYACSDLSIKTIGHQHGACYIKRHAAYIMDGIEPGEYKWFDNVIVWGEYWRDHALKNTKVYLHDFFLIGSNKLQSYSYSISKSSSDRDSRKNVLIPYEFLANTYLIGKYIRKLVDLGYTIYFKARPDEEVKDELDAYCLPEECKKQIIVVQDITDAFMAEIDIVAGTQTALIYELLPYGKEIWIFDTEFRLLYDLVEQGYAKLVKYEDLDCLRINNQCVEINKDYFFNPMSLTDTINKYVLKANSTE